MNPQDPRLVRDPDDTIRAWFHDGPSRGTERGLEATLARVATARQGGRRELRVPVWLPIAAVLAVVLAALVAFGAGFRVVYPVPDASRSPLPTGPASSCRLDVPVHGRDAIVAGYGFAPDTDVVLVVVRANGTQVTLDVSLAAQLHTDRLGGFSMGLRPYPEDLGTGRITATAGCLATLDLVVTAADLPVPCGDPAQVTSPVVDGPAYRAAVAADRPVAWWSLDDTGAAAADAAGGHPGTYEGRMVHSQRSPLSDGGSAFFDHVFLGPDTYVGFKPIALSGDYSVEAWIYFCHWADGDPIVGNLESNAGYSIGEGEVHGNNGEHDIVWTGKAVVSGEWQHYVFTRSGDDLAIYLNGNLDGSEPNAGWTGDLTLATIGRSFDGNYLGYIDEVAIYDYALDPARVAAHAHP